MKKGTIVAIVVFLILLALFGYSYYANKSSTPSPEKEVVLSATASANKEAAINSNAREKNQASPSSTKPANNTINKTILKPTTSPVVSNEPAPEGQAPRNAGEAIEQATKNGESMWLLFRSTTCASCVEMQKVFDQLEPDYNGKIRFIAIDVNDRNNTDTLRTWQIQYIPTTFIMDGAGKVSYKNVGIIPLEDLQKELNKVVK